MARAFGGFLRAQLILAAIQALLVAVVGTIFDIPYLFLWGTISALAMLIPFFGPPLALIPPIAAALIYTPWFIPVALILLVVQTTLVNWLQPRLMRDALGLHPLLVLVGLADLTGSEGTVWLWLAFGVGYMLARAGTLGWRVRDDRWMVTGATRTRAVRGA